MPGTLGCPQFSIINLDRNFARLSGDAVLATHHSHAISSCTEELLARSPHEFPAKMATVARRVERSCWHGRICLESAAAIFETQAKST